MIQRKVRYPLGIQTFSVIREEGYLYIDKTEYVYNMTHSDSRYIFLSRPRRFGKSLLTSTLRSYFEGRRDLFEGLKISELETEWTEYPVLHFSMAMGKHQTPAELKAYLQYVLRSNAERLGIETDETAEANIGLMQLIEGAYRKYGQSVVVLIDEYDAPLLDVMHEDEQLPQLRHVMRNFYSPLKDADPMLRFVFLTGITKFSQLSIFSELNNIKNISMMKPYAGICGITKDEVLTQMNDGIEALAEEQNMTRDEAIAALKNNYDGYHFAWPSPDVYNPFSLLNALSDRELEAYWFGSGTPTYLIEMLRKFDVSPSELGSSMQAKSQDFDAPTENMASIIPLLYQSGYITIKGYDPLIKLYTLDIPNQEIRIGLMESLLPNYLGRYVYQCNTNIAYMQRALLRDDIDEMLGLLQTFLGTIPQADNMNKPENYEAHWQQMLYIIFSLLGSRVDVEVRTPRGRVDMVARTAQRLYVMELKLNQSAEAAMNQIDLKKYPERFALCGLPVVKVGVNFDAEERNVKEWVIEETINDMR